MSKILVEIPAETYRRLQEEARKAGKSPEVLTRELIQMSLRSHEAGGQKTTREVLQASGRVRPLSESLRRKIIPGVTLEEVRMSLSSASGPPLSEIILRQRGPKA